MAHTKALVAYYHCTMRKKPLIQPNPSLRAPEQYRKALVANASSSTAIETGATVANLTVVRPLLTHDGKSPGFAGDGYLITDSSFGLVTSLRTPWAWSSSNVFCSHHLPTVLMSTLAHCGRTLHVT